MSKRSNAKATQRWRDKQREAGKCVGCGKRKPKPGKARCGPCLDYHAAWNRKNRDKLRPKARVYRRKLRKLVVTKYGGACKCCGESRLEFLAIDHKNGDGASERRKLFGTNTTRTTVWYLKLKREPKRRDLQVLCHNCNIAIGLYGYCPHQET